MWEKTLIGSNEYNRRKAKWTIPVAALLHAVVVSGIIFTSYWHVEAVEAPQSSLQYFSPIRVTIGPPPAFGQNQHPRPTGQAKQSAAVHEVQPSVVPPLSSDRESSEPPVGTGQTETDSDLPFDGPNGVIGGDPNSKILSDFSPTGADSDEPQVMTLSMTEPVLIRRMEPQYPRMALMARIQGVVILQALITRSGSVEEVKTLRADDPLLEKAAKDTVLQWQYKPATLRGQPVKVYFTVTVTFHLK